MQYLEYIENRFESLSKLIKIELFLFPIILICIVFYFNDNEKIVKKDFNNNLQLNNIKMKTNIVNILDDIENFAKKNGIKLLDISNNNLIIKIKVETKSYEKFLLFLKYLEDYNPFSKLISISSELDFKEVFVSFDKFYVKEKFSLNLQNIIQNKNFQKKFKLNAIVNKKAYINKQWLNEGDSLEQFKIIKIEKNTILIKGKTGIFILEIFDAKKL